MKKKKAVALRYRNREPAPRIVARGEERMAELIVKTAKTHGIPVEENSPLVRTLMQFDVGDYIPEDVYEVVAQLLIFVYRLKLGEGHGNEEITG